MNMRVVVGLLAVLAAGPCMALQATFPTPPTSAQSAPASQIHSGADEQLQASVRKAIANDSSLSDASRQVNVVVVAGAVVLRGKVKNDTEKARIDTLVRQVSGVKEVTNELDVKPQGSPG